MQEGGGERPGVLVPVQFRPGVEVKLPDQKARKVEGRRAAGQLQQETELGVEQAAGRLPRQLLASPAA